MFLAGRRELFPTLLHAGFHTCTIAVGVEFLRAILGLSVHKPSLTMWPTWIDRFSPFARSVFINYTSRGWSVCRYPLEAWRLRRVRGDCPVWTC